MEEAVENLHEICRLCALESESGVCIFSAEGESNLMEEKILNCLRIKVSRSDPLSKNVCAMCNMLLEELHQFCCRAASAQQTLAYLLEMDKKEDNLIKNFKSEANCIKFELEESVLASEIDELNSEYPEFEEHELLDNHQSVFYDQDIEPKNHTLKSDSQDLRVDLVDVTAMNVNEKQGTAANSNEPSTIDLNRQVSPLKGKKVVDLKTRKRRCREYRIVCPICRNIFNVQDDFELHCQDAHNQDPAYFCSQCDKKLKNFRSYRSHCNRHSAKYSCHNCDKQFSRMKPLRVHVLACRKPIQSFECHCGKIFSTKSGLSKHSRLHEGLREYPCLQCNKILQSKGGLRKHVTTHLQGRRFQCHLCGKTFTQKVNLQQHVTTHRGIRPFSCSLCSKSFSAKSHLKRHLRSHSQERPFECSVCSKLFKTASCLKVHSQTHKDFKPFVCEECGKEFRIMSKLKLHIKCHLSDKPFSCRQCDKKFNIKSSAMNHENRCRKLGHVRAPFKEEFEIQSLMSGPYLEPLDSLDLLNIPNLKEENEALFRDSVPTSLMETHSSLMSLSCGDLYALEF